MALTIKVIQLKALNEMRKKCSDTQMRAKCAKFLNGKSIITITAKRKAAEAAAAAKEYIVHGI